MYHHIYKIVFLLAALQPFFCLCAFASYEAQQETLRQRHEEPPNLVSEFKQRPAAAAANQANQQQQHRQQLENTRTQDNSATIISSPVCKDDREFHCKLENRCIPLEWRCDFREQCLDGQDELNCPPEWCNFDHNLCHWLNDLARNSIEGAKDHQKHQNNDDGDEDHHHYHHHRHHDHNGHEAGSNDKKNDELEHPDQAGRMSGDLVGRAIWRRYQPTEYRGNILITRVLQELMTPVGPPSLEDHSQHDGLGKFAFVPMILDDRKRATSRSMAIISSPLIGQTNSGCQLRFKYSLFANQTTSAPLPTPTVAATTTTTTTSYNNTGSLVFEISLTLRAKTSDGKLSTIWSRTLDFNTVASRQADWLVGVAELGHLSRFELSFAAESQIINNNELEELERETQEGVGSRVMASDLSSSSSDLAVKNISYNLSNISRVGPTNGDKTREHPKTGRRREQRQHGFAIIALRWLKFHDCRWPRASVALNGPQVSPGLQQAHNPLGQQPQPATPQHDLAGGGAGGPPDDQSQADNNNNRQHRTRKEAKKPDNNPLDLQSFRENSSNDGGDDDPYSNSNSNSDDDYNWPGTSGRQIDSRHCPSGAATAGCYDYDDDDDDDDDDEDYYDEDYHCSSVTELPQVGQLMGQGHCLEDEFECPSNGICLARWRLCNLVNNCMTFNGDGLPEDEAQDLCGTVPGVETFDEETMPLDKKVHVGYQKLHEHNLNISQFWSLDPGNWPHDMIRVLKSSSNSSQPFLPSQDHTSKQTWKTTSSPERMEGKFLSFLVMPEEVNFGKLVNIKVQNQQTIQWASLESPLMQKLAHDQCRLKFFYNIVASSPLLNQQVLPFKIYLAVEHQTLANIKDLAFKLIDTKRRTKETRPRLDAILHSHPIDIDRLILDGKQSSIEYPGVDFWREFNQPLVNLDEGDIFLIRLTIYIESTGDQLQAKQILTRTVEEIHSKATINIDDISLHFGCHVLAEEPLLSGSQQHSNVLSALEQQQQQQAKNADYGLGPKRFFRPETSYSNSATVADHRPLPPPLPLINRRRNKWNYYRHIPNNNNNNNNTSSETTSTTTMDNGYNYSAMSQVEPQKLVVYLFGVVGSIVGLIAIIVFVLVPYVERVMMSYEEQIQLGLGSEVSDVPHQNGGLRDFGPSGGPSGGDLVSFGESIRPLDGLARYQQQQQHHHHHQKQWCLIGSQADSGFYHQHQHHRHQQHHQESPQAPGSCVDPINGSASANSTSFLSSSPSSSSTSSSSSPSSPSIHPTSMTAAFVDSEMYHHKLEFIRSRMASNSSNSLAILHHQTSSFATNNNNSLNHFNDKTTSEF